MFFNIRLMHTGIPIQFAAHRPFLQVQPIHRQYYSDEFLNSFAVESGMGSLTSDDWTSYQQTVVDPNKDRTRAPGAYISTARKRRTAERQCPMAALIANAV